MTTPPFRYPAHPLLILGHPLGEFDFPTLFIFNRLGVSVAPPLRLSLAVRCPSLINVTARCERMKIPLHGRTIRPCARFDQVFFSVEFLCLEGEQA